jgi:hypothetical protein
MMEPHDNNVARPVSKRERFLSRLRFIAFLLMATSLFFLLIDVPAQSIRRDNGVESYLLRYRLASDEVWMYRTTTTQKTDMEMLGQSLPVEITIVVEYSVRGEGNDPPQNIRATLTLDTLSMTFDIVPEDMAIDLSPWIGKKMGLILSPTGDETFVGIDTLPDIRFDQISDETFSIHSLLRNPFPDLPSQPIRIGDTWQGGGSYSQTQRHIDTEVTTHSTNTLEDIDTLDGLACLRMKTKMTGTLDGSGKQMGMDVVFEGDLESTTTWYFAHETGTLVKLISDQFMEGTIAVAGQVEMVVPMTQQTRIVSQLLR